MRDLAPYPGTARTCSRETRLRVLRSARWFAELDDEQLSALNEKVTSFAWEEGQALQVEGGPARALHVIAAGAAKIVRSRRDGAPRILDIAVPGDVVGVLPELGGETYSDSVISLVPTCALRIDAASFHGTLRAFPQIALHVVDDLAGRLAYARSEMVAAAGSVEERVAGVIVHLADAVGVAQEDGIRIDLPLSRADVAGLSGSTVESVSRTISRWRREGLIDSGRRWTVVRDLHELRRRGA